MTTLYNRFIKYLLAILIVLNILLSAYWLIMGDIHYDVDVSRDFLVMNDIIYNHHLTLLGPRSGAIPGVFHGPLWFYVNLPAFFIGGGNPLVVGLFWFLLSIVFLTIIYWVSKKLFDPTVAILSVLLLSVNSIINPSIGLKNFYNPYGAVFLFPLFFWFFYRYTSCMKIKYLILSLFLVGLIIQFQMAFGVPLLITIIPLLFYILFKKKKKLHLLSFFILLIPLSTFILFDLKHNWLQLNAVMQFFSSKNSSSVFSNVLNERIKALIFDFFGSLLGDKNILAPISCVFFLTTLLVFIKKNIYRLFVYLFTGFWLVSLFFQGGVGNYFWPFLPVSIIIFCSFYKLLRREVFIVAFSLLYLVNFYFGISAVFNFERGVDKRGPHSWAFNLKVAENIYKDAGGDFGYFTYSPDRFSYQQRHAMVYAQKNYPNLKSVSSVKKPLTYLIEVDPPEDRPELDSINWRISDVKIDRLPDQTFRFDFIKVEKYFLSNEDIAKEPNPYLLDSVFLR